MKVVPSQNNQGIMVDKHTFYRIIHCLWYHNLEASCDWLLHTVAPNLTFPFLAFVSKTLNRLSPYHLYNVTPNSIHHSSEKQGHTVQIQRCRNPYFSNNPIYCFENISLEIHKYSSSIILVHCIGIKGIVSLNLTLVFKSSDQIKSNQMVKYA